MRILIINGPNLNMLGIREPSIYGNHTLEKLEENIKKYCKRKSIKIKFKQSNYEGKIIKYIHKAYKKEYDGIVINPGAFTHYSYAIFDAIKAVNIPTVAVHISDINNREEFRKKSVIKDACIKEIIGLGFKGYTDAIKFLYRFVSKN